MELKQNVALGDTVHYVGYDNEGRITSVTNEQPKNGKYIVTKYKEVECFLKGSHRFLDYCVKITKGAEPVVIKKQIEVIQDWNYSRFEIVNNIVDKNTNVCITWNRKKKQWQFTLSKDTLENYSLNVKLHFFVVLENNLDYLVRSMQVDLHEIDKAGKCTIAFNSAEELDIDKIKLITVPVFSKYGLVIK